jgi:hypothetical protein
MAGRGCSRSPGLRSLEEIFVRSVALLACMTFAACSPPRDPAAASKELIPAEWTVAEDTSASGEVTTVSLQLPAARQISGLVADQQPRLILRCIDHRIQAFIDTEQSDWSAGAEPGAEADTSARALVVPIQLDSAPACE